MSKKPKNIRKALLARLEAAISILTDEEAAAALAVLKALKKFRATYERK